MRTNTRRRGWTTLWLVIWLPVLMALFCGLVAVASLWLARVELENGLESAALAAVKEWGDAGGGDTLVPRQVGVAFAAANCVRGTHLALATNYAGEQAPCNQNLTCDLADGNLIFGAIDDSDPDHVVFSAGVCPSCALGNVLVDASAQGAGNLRQDNGWGIAFLHDGNTPPGLRIVKIVIDLQAGGGTGLFDLDGGDVLGPTLTDNVAPHAVSVSCMGDEYKQSDLVGFTDPQQQIAFTPSSGQSPTLTIEFFPDNDPTGGTDDGFAPCDRFRFGANVTGVGASTNPATDDDDGDGIGSDRAVVTVYFELDGMPLLPPSTGTFIDNDERSSQRLCPPQIDPSCGDLVVHPLLIPNLPAPPASGNNNNGQSYALVSGGGPGKFGVRAQAMVEVPFLGFPFLGAMSPSCVQAKATAEYDCLTRRVRLVRVHEFVCPGP